MRFIAAAFALTMALTVVSVAGALGTSPAAAAILVSAGDDVPPGAGRIIGSPDAGPEPESSGDRGGWAQLATLGVVSGGLAFVAWRVAREARRAGSGPG